MLPFFATNTVRLNACDLKCSPINEVTFRFVKYYAVGAATLEL